MEFLLAQGATALTAVQIGVPVAVALALVKLGETIVDRLSGKQPHTVLNGKSQTIADTCHRIESNQAVMAHTLTTIADSQVRVADAVMRHQIQTEQMWKDGCPNKDDANAILQQVTNKLREKD
jgi:hypothetical protein